MGKNNRDISCYKKIIIYLIARYDRERIKLITSENFKHDKSCISEISGGFYEKTYSSLEHNLEDKYRRAVENIMILKKKLIKDTMYNYLESLNKNVFNKLDYNITVDFNKISGEDGFYNIEDTCERNIIYLKQYLKEIKKAIKYYKYDIKNRNMKILSFDDLLNGLKFEDEK